MTLQQLSYIVELSKHTSISAAAQALAISQPSLSAAVKELEEEFHITILNRHQRGISFTPDGIDFLRFASAVVQQAHRLRAHFHMAADQQARLTLSISSQHYQFSADAFLQCISAIPPDQPYALTLREVRTAQVIQDVASQKSQAGILFISQRTEEYFHAVFARNELEFTCLHRFSPHVYLSSRHPLCGEERISLRQLKDYSYIKFDQQSDTDSLAEELFLPDQDAQQIIQVTDRATMFHLIRRTQAYTIGSGYLPDAAQQGLCAIPVKSPADAMLVGWIQKQGTPLTPEGKQYLDCLTRCLQEAAK